MADQPSRVSGLLNANTPFAPMDEREIADRIAGDIPSPQSPPPPEPADEEAAPAYVYVPTSDKQGSSPDEVRAEIREGADGAPTLAVYTSELLLDEALGNAQPRAQLAIIDVLLQISDSGISVALNPQLRSSSQATTGGTH